MVSAVLWQSFPDVSIFNRKQCRNRNVFKGKLREGEYNLKFKNLGTQFYKVPHCRIIYLFAFICLSSIIYCLCLQIYAYSHPHKAILPFWVLVSTMLKQCNNHLLINTSNIAQHNVLWRHICLFLLFCFVLTKNRKTDVSNLLSVNPLCSYFILCYVICRSSNSSLLMTEPGIEKIIQILSPMEPTMQWIDKQYTT